MFQAGYIFLKECLYCKTKILLSKKSLEIQIQMFCFDSLGTGYWCIIETAQVFLFPSWNLNSLHSACWCTTFCFKKKWLVFVEKMFNWKIIEQVYIWTKWVWRVIKSTQRGFLLLRCLCWHRTCCTGEISLSSPVLFSSDNGFSPAENINVALQLDK